MSTRLSVTKLFRSRIFSKKNYSVNPDLPDLNSPIIHYKMMRIKMKISYEACKKGVSVIELFIMAMIQAFH